MAGAGKTLKHSEKTILFTATIELAEERNVRKETRKNVVQVTPGGMDPAFQRQGEIITIGRMSQTGVDHVSWRVGQLLASGNSKGRTIYLRTFGGSVLDGAMQRRSVKKELTLEG